MKHTHVAYTAILVLIITTAVPLRLYAAEITDRSLSLSTSEPGATGEYTFDFSVPTSGTTIESFAVEICEEAADTCTTPAGFDGSAANLINQPSGFGDSSDWSVDTSDPDLLRMNNDTNSQTPDATQNVTFGNVDNPSATNETFFARLTTYANDDYTGEIDTGTVAASTAEAITIEGFVPPILTFCVGVDIPSDCSSASGNSLDLGTFSPGSTSSGISQMRASTNAGDGYAITVEGTTLSSGSNTIDGLNTPSTSQTEQSQFGFNLRDNTTPDVGEDPAGDGSATVAADYDTVDEFTFNAGDVVAQSGGPTNANTFTSAYITNIEPQQAAGTYTTTLTYIATATF